MLLGIVWDSVVRPNANIEAASLLDYYCLTNNQFQYGMVSWSISSLHGFDPSTMVLESWEVMKGINLFIVHSVKGVNLLPKYTWSHPKPKFKSVLTLSTRISL